MDMFEIEVNKNMKAKEEYVTENIELLSEEMKQLLKLIGVSK